MSDQTAAASITATKPHFAVLDGLRGVAAISVVVFHFMELVQPDYTKSFIAHAYLAVDFFFCLSGFVIAYAYDQRLVKLGIGNFLKLRLIRLHPLVIIGSVLGLVCFVFDPWSDLYQKYAGNLLLMFVASCVMIPYPLVRERYFNLFHLNPPTWSLFFEYIANIIYALVLVRIKKPLLWVLTIIAAIALFWEAQVSGNLSLGWSGDTMRGGLARMSFSFLAGMLVYRAQWIIRSKINFAVISVMLFVIFIVPYRDGFNKWFEPISVVFYFPFILALGAGIQQEGTSKKISDFLGEISYPLYMVHYPFIWWFMSWVEAKKPTMGEMTIVTAVGTVLLIGFAYLVMRLLDIPIRQKLKIALVKENK
ncbi:acyltransferase [Mucilaginibacter achroorhodeus]|uniref:Acyltransferase n=1 Tax=Mucilaginibacter achroorhodeus TaxID=2599294 RepID=A0A563U9C1_9SPHI|nr:acyltransferase [Mucilaginibacter achroorhodeus]TWR27926.1 acyltransferase [Mucilaginibacter achroorhodeus]